VTKYIITDLYAKAIQDMSSRFGGVAEHWRRTTALGFSNRLIRTAIPDGRNLDTSRRWRRALNGSKLAVRYSDEERDKILAESRAILERGRWEPHRAADEPPVADDEADKCSACSTFEPPIESRMERERRELDEQEQRFARERRRERRGHHRLDTQLVAVRDIDARIASALAAERQAVIPALRAAVDQLLEQEREHAKSQMTKHMRSLELQIAKLEIRIVRAASGARRRAREGNRPTESVAERELSPLLRPLQERQARVAFACSVNETG
jgi:hypothetical protein